MLVWRFSSRLGRSTRRGRAPLVGAAGLAVALSGCMPESSPTGPTPPTAAEKAVVRVGNWLSTPHLFVSDVQLRSLAASPGRLLGSTTGPSFAKLVTISETGTLQSFAPVFAPSPEAECHLEVADGTGVFETGSVLVGVGSEIWHLSFDGSTAIVLAELPAAHGPVTGLVLDVGGAFAYELLALTAQGPVHRISATGRVLQVGDLGPGGSGPAIAPSGFTGFAGSLLVAFPATSEVRALHPSGAVSTPLLWSGVAGVHAVPAAPRAFGETDGALFLATSGGQVYRYPLADVSARGGALYLTTIHRSGSGLIVPEPGGFRMHAFSRFVGVEVAAGFVRRPLVTPIGIDLMPGVFPKVINVGSTTPVTVALLAATGFVPSSLQGGEILFAGAPAVIGARGTWTSADVNADGRLDLLVRFRPSEMQLVSGDATLTLEATALEGDRLHGTARALVLEP